MRRESVILVNYGLFVPKTFRSLERKVLGTKSPDTILVRGRSPPTPYPRPCQNVNAALTSFRCPSEKFGTHSIILAMLAHLFSVYEHDDCIVCSDRNCLRNGSILLLSCAIKVHQMPR